MKYTFIRLTIIFIKKIIVNYFLEISKRTICIELNFYEMAIIFCL